MHINTQSVQIKMAERAWNFTQLSENCGISRQTLSTINGRGTCKPEVAAKIAKALDCSVSEIAREG